MNVYVIATEYDGAVFYYQLDNMFHWFFERGIKPYKRLSCAITMAKKLGAKYNVNEIKILTLEEKKPYTHDELKNMYHDKSCRIAYKAQKS